MPCQVLVPRLVTIDTSIPDEALKSAVWLEVATLNSSTLSIGMGITPEG